MATRVSNRPGRSGSFVPKSDAEGVETEDNEVEKGPKPRARKRAPAKAPAKPRIRKSVLKAPQRTVARWAVCDNAAKRVAVFEYRDRVAADAKLVNLRDTRPGTYFLALVKDPYDPPADLAVSG